MSVRAPLLVSFLIVAAMTAAGYWAWQQLPAHALITTHWDINGRPNGFMEKTWGLFIAPVVSLVLVLFLALLPQIEPRRANLAASGKLYRTGWYGALLVLAVVQSSLILTALHYPFDAKTFSLGAAAILFIALGNYFGKTRANFFAGIRTPWTLSSDYSWEMTHRLGGRLFVGAGAATLIALALGGFKPAIVMMLAALAVSVLACVVMSYVYWKRDPEKNGAPAMTE